MNSNLTVGITTNRRFSESSVDNLYKSEESIKRPGLNKRMGCNDFVNTKNPTDQFSNRRKCPRFYNEDDDDGDGCCCFDGGKRKKHINDAIDVGIRVMLVFIFM